MCHGDVTPLLIHKDKKSPLGERAGFRAHRKCRDFGQIREWAGNNVELFKGLRRSDVEYSSRYGRDGKRDWL